MDVPSQTTEAETETESALMLLPVGDLFNHGAQSLSRTKYHASSDSVTIVTATSFERGDEVVINYGNHSVSEFLVRYGFVPQGQLRSVSMEIAPWPLPSMQEATEVHAALGEAAVQPYSATERQLHRKLLAVRQHGPQEGFLNLFREGLDADSNFALRMLHLRQGGELSAYAIVSLCVCCPFCPPFHLPLSSESARTTCTLMSSLIMTLGRLRLPSLPLPLPVRCCCCCCTESDLERPASVQHWQ